MGCARAGHGVYARRLLGSPRQAGGGGRATPAELPHTSHPPPCSTRPAVPSRTYDRQRGFADGVVFIGEVLCRWGTASHGRSRGGCARRNAARHRLPQTALRHSDIKSIGEQSERATGQLRPTGLHAMPLEGRHIWHSGAYLPLLLFALQGSEGSSRMFEPVVVDARSCDSTWTSLQLHRWFWSW